MSDIKQNALELIGNTPILQLNNYSKKSQKIIHLNNVIQILMIGSNPKQIFQVVKRHIIK